MAGNIQAAVWNDAALGTARMFASSTRAAPAKDAAPMCSVEL